MELRNRLLTTSVGFLAAWTFFLVVASGPLPLWMMPLRHNAAVKIGMLGFVAGLTLASRYAVRDTLKDFGCVLYTIIMAWAMCAFSIAWMDHGRELDRIAYGGETYRVEWEQPAWPIVGGDKVTLRVETCDDAMTAICRQVDTIVFHTFSGWVPPETVRFEPDPLAGTLQLWGGKRVMRIYGPIPTTHDLATNAFAVLHHENIDSLQIVARLPVPCIGNIKWQDATTLVATKAIGRECHDYTPLTLYTLENGVIQSEAVALQDADERPIGRTFVQTLATTVNHPQMVTTIYGFNGTFFEIDRRFNTTVFARNNQADRIILFQEGTLFAYRLATMEPIGRVWPLPQHARRFIDHEGHLVLQTATNILEWRPGTDSFTSVYALEPGGQNHAFVNNNHSLAWFADGTTTVLDSSTWNAIELETPCGYFLPRLALSDGTLTGNCDRSFVALHADYESPVDLPTLGNVDIWYTALNSDETMIAIVGSDAHLYILGVPHDT